MKIRTLLAASVLVLAPLATVLDLPSGGAPAMAQSGSGDLFLKLDGIDGSATFKGHEKQIDLDSYAITAANSVSSAAGAAKGKSTIEGFTITKQLDASSTALFDLVMKGKHVKTATLTVRSSGAEASRVLVTYDLTDVAFSRYEVASTGGVPHESLSLSFASITTKVNSFGKDGKTATTTTSSYSLVAGK